MARGASIRARHAAALRDVKARWRGGLFWTSCLSVFVCLALCLAYVVAASEEATFRGLTACRPDGDFSLESYKYDYWYPSGFFQVTIGFGLLSFSEAKVVDTVWDVIVGRGGQGLLALISWHVFAKYVTASMATGPITFNTYRTVFLQPEGSFVSIPCLVRDFSKRHGLKSRAAMTFMITTLVFILVFPTFGSAMTGYSANVESYVQDAARNYVRFSAFEYAFYVVHDGARVGLYDDYPVSIRPHGTEEALLDNPGTFGEWTDVCFDNPNWMSNDALSSCYTLGNVTRYVAQYGLSPSTTANTSRFGTQDISSPTLNISAFWIPDLYVKRLGLTDQFAQLSLTDPDLKLNDPARRTWSADNQTYALNDIKKQGTCQAQKTYKWGFSFLQLTLMLLLLLLWTLGVLTMYISAQITLRTSGYAAAVGEYTAVFALASAVTSQLNTESDKEKPSTVHLLSESVIRRRVARELNGGSILLEKQSRAEVVLDGRIDDAYHAASSLGALLRLEIWWLVVFTILFLGVLVVVGFSRRAYWALLVPVEIVFVLFVGRSKGSRGVLGFWAGWWYVGRGCVPLILILFGVGAG